MNFTNLKLFNKIILGEVINITHTDIDWRWSSNIGQKYRWNILWNFMANSFDAEKEFTGIY